MLELFFETLFSDKISAKTRIKKIEYLFGSDVDLNSSDAEFMIFFLQKILDEFPFIQTLQWSNFSKFEYQGDSFPIEILEVEINNSFCESLVVYDWEINRYFHSLERAVEERKTWQSLKQYSDDYLRFMVGFALYHDIFSSDYYGLDSDPHFFEINAEKKLDEVYYGTYTEYTLRRYEYSFYCTMEQLEIEAPYLPK